VASSLAQFLAPSDFTIGTRLARIFGFNNFARAFRHPSSSARELVLPGPRRRIAPIISTNNTTPMRSTYSHDLLLFLEEGIERAVKLLVTSNIILD